MIGVRNGCHAYPIVLVLPTAAWGLSGRCIEMIDVRGAPTVPSHGRWHEIHLRGV